MYLYIYTRTYTCKHKLSGHYDICTHIYACRYEYLYMYIHIYTYMYMCIYTYIYMYICITLRSYNVYVHTHITNIYVLLNFWYIFKCINITRGAWRFCPVYIYMYMYTRIIYIHMYIHIYVCILVCLHIYT